MSPTTVPLQADAPPWYPFQSFLEWGVLLNDYLIPAGLFLVTLLVVYVVGKSVLLPVVDRILDSQGHDPTVKSLADSVMGVVVWLLAFALAFTVAGYGAVIAAFATLTGALALAIGFAAQDLMSNFVAGIFILRDEPFEVGDWIERGDIVGRVTDIDLRVTTVKTFDNEKITVPNSELANNPVKNPVAYDNLRQKFVFGIGYEDDIDRAKEVILEEADRIDGVLDDPGPSIRVTELADSYVGLQTRFHIADPGRSDFVRIRSDLVQAVKERFDAEGIDMPYPVRTVEGGLELDGELVTTDGESGARTTSAD